LVEQVFVENAGVHRGVKGVVMKDVPRAKNDVVEIGKRHKFLDGRHAVVGAFAETDRAHLEMPRLIASTPATKVVLTAPKPTSKIPSFPSAGAISTPLAVIYFLRKVKY